MRGIIVLVFVSLLMAMAGTARAGDQYARAQAVYNAHCARCHAIGFSGDTVRKRSTTVDLTLSPRQHNVAWLNRWIAKPHAVKKHTACYTAGLDPVQVQLLVAFLLRHIQPAPPHHQKIRKAEAAGPGKIVRRRKKGKGQNSLGRGR